VGTAVIDRLARDLRRDFPEMTGLSSRNLKYMRAFAEAWPDPAIVQQLVAQRPWGHNIRLLEALKQPEARSGYARQALAHGWSRAVLTHQIEGRLIDRAGKAPTNFAQTLPSPQSDLARELLKDPYDFEFLAAAADISERELERGLLDNLCERLLELGKGFAFVGSQYHLEIADQDFYLDLLFYHLRVRCFVVIDLEVDDFKPEYAGKMNFYLSAVDDRLRHPADAPTIGLILCKGRNEVIVEYALRDSAKPLGVAAYRVSSELPKQLEADLPTQTDLAREYPLMALVKLRIDIERMLRQLTQQHGAPNGPPAIRSMLERLAQVRGLPQSAAAFGETLRILNAATHGVDVSADAAAAALDAGTRLLDELKQLGVQVTARRLLQIVPVPDARLHLTQDELAWALLGSEGPARVKTHGKKREHGQHSYDFWPRGRIFSPAPIQTGCLLRSMDNVLSAIVGAAPTQHTARCAGDSGKKRVELSRGPPPRTMGIA
jgi:predicted nuclease of restriction endonuclease-like (RecB) superfamily